MKDNTTWLRIAPLILMLAIVHSSCGQKAFEKELQRLYKETVPLVKSEDLSGSELEDYYILDIRSPEEFQVSHLRNALWVGFKIVHEFDRER